MDIVYNKDKRKLCDLLIRRIMELSESSVVNLAVSGGSTPKILFSMMGQSPYSESINWENINIYWVDERCVPPTDDDSNYKMVYEAMLSKVGIPKENVFRIMGESDPSLEVERYNSLVSKNLKQQKGFPVFDLSLMGIGDDGHTSSIFPSEMSLLKSDKPYDLATNPYNGQRRIAMTGMTILNSRELVFLVTGENKKDVLSDIVKDNQKAIAYPSYHIIRQRSDAKLYTDVNI